MKRYISTVIFVLAFSSLTNAQLSGPLSGVITAGSYTVEGEISVEIGDSLIIEPGTVFNFQGHYKFIVNGWLFAEGTESDSIVFTVADTSEGWHGIRFISAVDSSRLEYCYLTNGKANSGGEDSHGGAIYCNNSNPIIVNCLLENCEATYGGAIYCKDNADPAINNNIIRNNSASQKGGGISCWNSGPIINGNIIEQNSAHFGGGIHCYYNSNPVISDNIISGNSAGDQGGGINCYQGTYPAITGNTISGNSAYDGGGIFCFDANPIISNNIIKENFADADGGGLNLLSSSSVTLVLNEICNNSAAQYGGGVYIEDVNCNMNMNTISYNQSPHSGGLYLTDPGSTLVNSIVWGNALLQITGMLRVTYSDIQGGWEGEGNINADPMFVDPVNGNYHLTEGSPCIDAGDPASPLDPDSTRADMGAYYFDQTPLVIEDLTISISGENVQLNWSEIPGAILYHVYRSTEPYFDISGMAAIASPMSNTYTDTNAAMGEKWFYRITCE